MAITHSAPLTIVDNLQSSSIDDAYSTTLNTNIFQPDWALPIRNNITVNFCASGQTQLAAHHLSILVCEMVITHTAPLTIVENLQTSSIHQSCSEIRSALNTNIFMVSTIMRTQPSVRASRERSFCAIAVHIIQPDLALPVRNTSTVKFCASGQTQLAAHHL